MDDEPRYWYRVPTSWGYRHAITWEGWVFDIVGVLALFGIGPYVRQPTHPFKSLGLVFGILAFTVAVHRWKGEPGGA